MSWGIYSEYFPTSVLNSTNVSGWWFGTWLDYFPFHRKGMSSETHWRTPSFFKMVIAPPTRYFCWGWTAKQIPAILATVAGLTPKWPMTLQVRRTPSISATLSRQVRCFWASVFFVYKGWFKHTEDIWRHHKTTKSVLIWYDIWYDMIWYIWYDMISYIWYMISYIYDMIWYDIIYFIYDIIYIWYIIWLLYMKVQLLQYVSIKY